MQPLGKNQGGYHGETIDILSVLNGIEVAAKKCGWKKEIFYRKGQFEFFALRRTGSLRGKKVYISSGIHGDEPAGPSAVQKLIEEDRWSPDLDIWLCPCLNPIGFTLNRRENEEGIDLNRDYKAPKTPEIQAHIAWLERQPNFDLILCLHEDWEAKGFYILESDDQLSIAETIIKEVKSVFPIDLSLTIETFPAQNGIVHPHVDMDQNTEWPEAFYLMKNKGGQHYTFEAASDFPLQARIDALVTGTRAAITSSIES